jgi:hypothetical protein
LIIYIYGSDKFKKDIHKVLDHSNIKFRLDEQGEIVDLETLDELKDAIEDNPDNIYLIDDSKIIKKNSINQKIKFLQPKDGINQEYLLDHGIGDMSIDSIDELSTHIIKKLEAMDLGEEEIQDSIIEIVEDAYEKDSDEETSSYQLDDELSALLSATNGEDEATFSEENIQKEDKEETSEEEILNSVEAVDEISFLLGDNGEDKEAVESDNENDEENEELPSLGELSFEEYFDSITQEENKEEENKEENNKIYIEDVPQGEKMADEFSEFDTLSENDILAALNGLDNVSVTNEKKDNLPSSESSESKNESLDISSSNSEDIAKLITQLLNNKTLEITIKVKD